MDKKKTLCAGIVLCAVVAMFLYILISPSENDIEVWRSFMILLFAASNLLSRVFTNRSISMLPEAIIAEVMEDEDYILSKNRTDLGGKLMIVGGIMAGIPLLIMLIKGSAGGIFAWSLIFGFFIFIGGLILCEMGESYTFEISEEMQQKYNLNLVESPISRICSIIAVLALIAWIVLFFLGR